MSRLLRRLKDAQSKEEEFLVQHHHRGGSRGIPGHFVDTNTNSKGEDAMFKAMAFAIGALLVTQSAFADDREKLIGIWKVISFDNEFQDGSPRRALYGQHPSGHIILTAEGRMMAVVVGEGRQPVTTDEERASLLRTMFAYSGI